MLWHSVGVNAGCSHIQHGSQHFRSMAASSGRMDSCFSRGLIKKLDKKEIQYLFICEQICVSERCRLMFSHFSAAAKFGRHFGNDQQVAVVNQRGTNHESTFSRTSFSSFSLKNLTVLVLPVSHTFLLNHVCFWSILVCGPRLHHVQAGWSHNSRMPPPYFKWCQRGPFLV